MWTYAAVTHIVQRRYTTSLPHNPRYCPLRAGGGECATSGLYAAAELTADQSLTIKGDAQHPGGGWAQGAGRRASISLQLAQSKGYVGQRAAWQGWGEEGRAAAGPWCGCEGTLKDEWGGPVCVRGQGKGHVSAQRGGEGKSTGALRK